MLFNDPSCPTFSLSHSTPANCFEKKETKEENVEQFKSNNANIVGRLFFSHS